MDEPFVTGGTVRGTARRRTNVVSLARATLRGLPFPVSDTSGKDASSAPFFCLLFFGKTKKSRCRPAQGQRQKTTSKTRKGKERQGKNQANNQTQETQKKKKFTAAIQPPP